MNVVGYIRVSTKEQAEGGYGLDAQRDALVKAARARGWTLVRVFSDEGQSAKTMHRPQFQQMLEYCRSNAPTVDIVAVHKIDRLARNQHDYHVAKALLAKSAVSIQSLSERIEDTPEGRFVENMFASIAQFDNDVRAKRTTDGMKAAFEQGRWLWKAPIGYRRGAPHQSSLVHDQERAPLVRELFERYATGRYNKREICDLATNLGLRTDAGKALPQTSIDKLLANPIYKGRIVSAGWGLEAEGDFTPIVDADTFDRASLVLRGLHGPRPAPSLDHPALPLRRFVRCAACETPLTGSFSTGKMGKKYGYYRCPKKQCRAVNVPKQRLEKLFEHKMADVLPASGVVEVFCEIIRAKWQEREKAQRAELRRQERRVAAIQAKKDKLVEAHVYDKALDAQTYKRHMEQLDVEEAISRMAQHDQVLESIDIESVLNFAQAVLGTPLKAWKMLNPAQKVEFQRFVFPEGLTFDGQALGTRSIANAFKELGPVLTTDPTWASPTVLSWNSVAEFVAGFSRVEALAA